MYYMNKTKRNLILASAIINLISVTVNLILSILLVTNGDQLIQYSEYFLILSYSTNIFYAVLSFCIGVAASILLFWAVREKGKYYRRCQGIFATGFALIIIFGGWLAWLLLFISLFIPDIIVMNTKSELREEARVEDAQNKQKEQEYEEKKQKIEELQKLRDSGQITEEEYKKRLFELL